MEIRLGSLNFPSTSGTGPQTAESTITFPRRILRATAGMIGYTASFVGDDHHLGRLTVELGSTISPGDDTQLIVSGEFGLRDWSNEWDDSYSGNIQFAVLAELELVSPPLPGEPRGDLIIVDAEISQVVQHFRSGLHLDSANVFPDNSIRMVANKPTAVRLYVDYDASSGLPAIASLSGTLEVVRGSITTTLTPLTSIVPRRDVQIDRGVARHTLTFIIPEDQSRGEITIQARVFNTFDNTQFSRTFERTLTFDTMPALPLIAVGINYTGPDVNDDATAATLAAPGLADFISTLTLTEKLFPIPQVTITSFLTMDYDEEVESDISEGCDKLDDLLDAVRDMRGDSEDIVLGLFNTGVNTGSVGGCGGGAAAVGRTGRGGTAAHELGHALGRQHAPCDNVTRCATPANTDGGYPTYSGYDSDSIGEYGIDTSNGVVKVPSVAHDIMGYSDNKWISPYTYKALMSRIPEQTGAGAAAESSRLPQDRGDWIKIKQQQLFLNLSIDREREVTLRPSFVFAAYPQPRGTLATAFVAELIDANGRVLKRACLFASAHGASCNCAQGLWPLRIRQAMSFHPAATRLVIYEHDKLIWEMAVGAAPEVYIEVRGADIPEQDYLDVAWQARCGEGERALWYLVQWRDARGIWRGAAPRTQETSLRIPKSLFGRQTVIAVRVLASAGIATGESFWQGDLAQPPIEIGRIIRIGLVDVPATASGAVALPYLLRASLSVGSSTALSGAELRWYDRLGGEIGRGRSIDLRTLSVGFHTITAVALDTGDGAGSESWLIEHRRDGQFILHLNNASSTQVKE